MVGLMMALKWSLLISHRESVNCQIGVIRSFYYSNFFKLCPGSNTISFMFK